MTFWTETRVVSRTFAAPLMTRETVPTPTPEAAATSAMVARRCGGMVTLHDQTRWNRFHQVRSSLRRAAAPSRADLARSAVCRYHLTERLPGYLSDRSRIVFSLK